MSALSDYRTSRFKQRQITFYVTPSEYLEFAQYLHSILPDYLDPLCTPDPICEDRACLFYRMANSHVVWHDPEDRNTPDDMPSMVIPFCLLGYKAPETIYHPSQITAIKMCRSAAQSAADALQDVCNALNEIIRDMERPTSP